MRNILCECYVYGTVNHDKLFVAQLVQKFPTFLQPEIPFGWRYSNISCIIFKIYILKLSTEVFQVISSLQILVIKLFKLLSYTLNKMQQALFDMQQWCTLCESAATVKYFSKSKDTKVNTVQVNCVFCKSEQIFTLLRMQLSLLN